jgi:hypothetical protein
LIETLFCCVSRLYIDMVCLRLLMFLFKSVDGRTQSEEVGHERA